MMRPFKYSSRRSGAFFGIAVAILSVLSMAANAEPQCVTNLAHYKGVVEKALADHTIDQIVYDDQRQRIAKIESLCAVGNDQQANALIFGSMMALNFGADDTYERKVNKH